MKKSYTQDQIKGIFFIGIGAVLLFYGVKVFFFPLISLVLGWILVNNGLKTLRQPELGIFIQRFFYSFRK